LDARQILDSQILQHTGVEPVVWLPGPEAGDEPDMPAVRSQFERHTGTEFMRPGTVVGNMKGSSAAWRMSVGVWMPARKDRQLARV
jgi:hypothetical protein